MRVSNPLLGCPCIGLASNILDPACCCRVIYNVEIVMRIDIAHNHAQPTREKRPNPRELNTNPSYTDVHSKLTTIASTEEFIWPITRRTIRWIADTTRRARRRSPRVQKLGSMRPPVRAPFGIPVKRPKYVTSKMPARSTAISRASASRLVRPPPSRLHIGFA